MCVCVIPCVRVCVLALCACLLVCVCVVGSVRDRVFACVRA